MLKRPRTVPLAIVVAFALIVAACGSSSKSGSGSTTTTPGGTSASVPSGPEIKIGAQGFSEREAARLLEVSARAAYSTEARESEAVLNRLRFTRWLVERGLINEFAV